MGNPGGKGGFKASWKNLPTESIRVPTVFKAVLLATARELDAGTITEAQLQAFLLDWEQVLANLPRHTKTADSDTLKEILERVRRIDDRLN